MVVELAVECTEGWKHVCDHSSGHLDARECHHCSGHFTCTVLMVEERGREKREGRVMIYKHVDYMRQAFLSTFDGGRRPRISKLHAHANLEITEKGGSAFLFPPPFACDFFFAARLEVQYAFSHVLFCFSTQRPQTQDKQYSSQGMLSRSVSHSPA